MFAAVFVCVMEKSLEALSERTSVAEKMGDFLQKQYSEAVTESRKRKLGGMVREVDGRRESLEKWARDLEGRERRIRDLAILEGEVSSKRVRPLGEARMSEKLEKIEGEEERLRLERESLAEKEKKVDVVIGALDGRIRAVEEKEEELNLFVEGKRREIALKEVKLEEELGEFAEKVKLADEKFMEQEMWKHGFLERIELAESKLDGLRVKMDEKLEEVEFKGNVGWESLALSVKEADLVTESVEEELEELDKRKQEFSSFQEEKAQELASKEKLLDVMSKRLVKDAELRNEQLMEREKLGLQLLERLQLAKHNVEGQRNSVYERLGEIGLKMQELASKEQLLNEMSTELVKDAKLRNEQLIEREKLGHQLVERLELATDNVEGMRRRAHERFEEIGLKMQELASKEKLLDVMSRELVKDAELRNEQLIEQEKSGHQLMKRLELAQDDVKRLKISVDKRFMELCLKENELDSLSDWVERKMDEVDLKEQKLKEQEHRITKIEDHLISKKDELQGKEKSLWAWQKKLEHKQKEIDLARNSNEQQLRKLDAREKNLEDKQKEIDFARKSNEQQLEKLDAREKNLTSVREFTRNCFKEHLAIKRKLELEKNLFEKSARDLVLREEQLNHAIKEFELRVKELEFQQQHSTNVSNAPLGIEPDESVDIKFIVRMDGKTLQMFLNDPEKDLVSMGDEIFHVLQLSSDPAKLVLDAMEGFYPPHLREEDVELNVRKTCIALLMQLCKMSPNMIIKPHVRKEAIEVATSWKSKMRGNAENAEALEVFGFLFLLSAFDLTSYFDKD